MHFKDSIDSVILETQLRGTNCWPHVGAHGLPLTALLEV
jgi:hypothetical protein